MFLVLYLLVYQVYCHVLDSVPSVDNFIIFINIHGIFFKYSTPGTLKFSDLLLIVWILVSRVRHSHRSASSSQVTVTVSSSGRR